jgi:hypothetical protein
MTQNRFLPLRIGNFIAFAAVVVINTMAVLLPINGVTPQVISDTYANLFAPAGITFSIWSVIYVLLALFALYGLGLFKGKKGASMEAIKRIGPFFMISSAANVAWIFSWHYDIIPLSMALMAVLLVTLIAAYLRIRKEPLTGKEKWFVLLPMSVYFGWITIATIANVTVLLVSQGVDAFGPAAGMWTIIILTVGLAIGAAVVLKFRDIAYGIVLAWAYLGILIKHTTTQPFAGQYPGIVTALIVLLAAGVVIIALAGVLGRKRTLQKA